MKSIICDIDGTLAIMATDRSPFDWHRVGEDGLNIPVAEAVKTLSKEFAIILLSGRMEQCRQQTIDWLVKHEIPFEDLYMRQDEDFRGDPIVKKEIYDNHIKEKYQVYFVLDDRNRVVDMWRKELLLPCFQVNYGDF